MNNSQVAHLWANQARESARGSSFFFDGDTIYSYGTHFPIARHIPGRNGAAAVLFTTRRYSNSTAKHIGHVRGALYGLNLPVFHVEKPRDQPRTDSVKAEYTARIKAETETAARSRLYAETYMTRAAELATEANQCAAFFGWKWRIKVPTLAPEFIAKVRERVRKESAAKRERAAEIVAEWRTGQHITCPGAQTLLRVKGDQIETSRGASIPVAHAARLWRVIQRAKAGEPYQRNGHTEHAGEFKVDSIDTAGTMRAGCHVIEYAELAHLAHALELPGGNCGHAGCSYCDSTGPQD